MSRQLLFQQLSGQTYDQPYFVMILDSGIRMTGVVDNTPYSGDFKEEVHGDHKH
jgi:hypothetical protein